MITIERLDTKQQQLEVMVGVGDEFLFKLSIFLNKYFKPGYLYQKECQLLSWPKFTPK